MEGESRKVTEKEIFDGFVSKEGESALDFINNNLKRDNNPSRVVQPNQDLQNAAKEVFDEETKKYVAENPNNPPAPEPPANKPTEQSPSKDPEIKFDFDDKKEEPKNVDPQEDAQKTAEVSGEDDSEEEVQKEGVPIEVNYKKLREVHKETKTTLKTIQKDLETKTKELEQYKNGEVIPEVLQKKEQEIERLSHYEKLFNLKQSNEYNEKFVKPIDTLKAKALDLFKECSVPEDFVDQILNADNMGEVNRFLSENFDALTGVELKQIVRDVNNIRNEAKKAEAEPLTALERIQAESRAAQEVQEIQRRERIANNAKQSWVNSLLKVRAEGKFTELIRRPDDEEFNRNFVDPLLTAASQDYQRIIIEFTKHGAKDIPKELAEVVADAVLRAHASSISIEARNHAIKQLNTLEENTRRRASMVRPPVGGGVGGSSAPPKPAPKLSGNDDLEASIDSFLQNTVLSKR